MSNCSEADAPAHQLLLLLFKLPIKTVCVNKDLMGSSVVGSRRQGSTSGSLLCHVQQWRWGSLTHGSLRVSLPVGGRGVGGITVLVDGVFVSEMTTVAVRQ